MSRRHVRPRFKSIVSSQSRFAHAGRSFFMSVTSRTISAPRLDAEFRTAGGIGDRKKMGVGMNILVVDDELPIVEAVAYNLKKEGYNVLVAADAEQCLEITRRE